MFNTEFVSNQSVSGMRRLLWRIERKYILVRKSVAGSVVKLSQSAVDQMSYLMDSLVQPVCCCKTQTFVMDKI